MILDLIQITEIIKTNPNKTLIDKGIAYCKKLRRHMYGEGLEEHMSLIEGHERKELLKTRKKYSKSNKDIFSRQARPIDKAFSARGGSVYLNLPTAQEKAARNLAANVRDGYSVRKWVETFWKPHMLDDPFGLTFLEIQPLKQAILSKQQGKSFVYPTYKPVSMVFDYLPKGNQLEYVVFTLTNAEKKAAGFKPEENIYRVVDDAFDYLVKKDGDQITIITGQTYPNYFGQVPALINSDIVDPTSENCFLSFFDDVVELADQYFLKGSIKVHHDLLHGFPKYAEYADNCPACKGTRYVGAEECKACGGSGKKLMTHVSDAKMLEWPDKDDTPVKPAEVAAYISPDKTYHEIATADILDLENLMCFTLWGTQSRVKSQGPVNAGAGGEAVTATQVMDEIKPQSDRLFGISEMAEKRHKFILDAVIRLQVNQAYDGSSVNYGRRYMLEGPDAVWLKYADARTKGAPQYVLDSLLNEYYEAAYQSDPMGLEMAKKLMYVEPFVHLTPGILKGLNPDPADYTAKLYFSEWLAMQSEIYLLITKVEDLRSSLYEYTKTKTIPVEKPVPAIP